MTDKKFIEGIRVFAPNAKAPEFVKAEIVITLNDLVKFCKENPDLLTEYNGQKQLKLSVKAGSKGYYAEVNNWQPKTQKQDAGDLPF